MCLPSDPLLEKKKSLENEKKILIERIKAVNRRLRYKQYELKALSTMKPKTPAVPLPVARRTLNQLEFRIATESTNLKQERQMMRQIREAEEQYAEAANFHRFNRKVTYVNQDIETAKKEAEKLDIEIKKKREQILEIEKQMGARKRHATHEKKERKSKESGPSKEEIKEYMQAFDSTVSLEDICVIRRKNEKK